MAVSRNGLRKVCKVFIWKIVKWEMISRICVCLKSEGSNNNSTDRASVWFLNGWFCDKLMTIAFVSHQSWCLYSKIIQKHPLIFCEISPLIWACSSKKLGSNATHTRWWHGSTWTPGIKELPQQQVVPLERFTGVTNLVVSYSYNAHKLTNYYVYIYIYIIYVRIHDFTCIFVYNMTSEMF